MSKKIIVKSSQHTANKKRQIKKRLRFAADFTLLAATVTGFCWLIAVSYPAGEVVPQEYAGNAHLMEWDRLSQTQNPEDVFFSPEEFDQPVPRPAQKPQWIKERGEFQAQLEKAVFHD